MGIPQYRFSWNQISLLGVKIDALTLDELLAEITRCVMTGRQVTVLNVNIHAMNIAYSDPPFRDFLNQSQITFCDGVGVKWAARLTGQHLEDRFTPPDFVDRICAAAIRQRWKAFFLGAKPGVAQRAAQKLMSQFPGLEIQTHHGYFDKTKDCQENRPVVAMINDFQPQVLILGFGMPLQEKWILENMDSMRVNIVIPAGALFDYLAGEVPRAPRWMTDNGFEWLGRLLIEPRRLWRRYIFGNPLFFWRVFMHHFMKRPLPE
jgi:N-acetylglucosaminyldiphosphoundecaprenol N-acetyl-beta-D-mannosaminyltransferase